MNHTDIYEDTWEDKRDEWLPYLEDGCVVFSFLCNARYTMNMESDY